MKPPGIRKEKEFDFFVPSKHRERQRAQEQIGEQLEAHELAASDIYDDDDWYAEVAALKAEHDRTRARLLVRALRLRATVHNICLGLSAPFPKQRAARLADQSLRTADAIEAKYLKEKG